MTTPRILIVINTSWNIYNFRGGLIRALTAKGYEVIAAAPRDEYSDRLSELGCRYVPLEMDNKGTSPIKDLSLLFRFLVLLRRERPDVFLGWTIKPNVYGSLAAHACGIPVINNVSGLGTAFIRNSWLTRLAKALYRAAFARSRVVFFQNEDDRTLFTEEQLVRPEKTALVPGSGVDLVRFQPRPPHFDGQFRFLVVARLLWDKGIQEFVDAARLVRRQESGARFQLLGFLDVENRTAVSRAAVEGWGAEGLIEYLGTARDVRDHIAAADCVVLPSYREGTPRSLLEAAAMGKPLITTDVPGCRNVVDHGVNGFLCVAQDASDLANHMLKMIRVSDERRAAMGAASRTKAEQSFDENIVITKYLAAVDEALESRGLHNGRYASSAGRKLQPSHH